MTVPFPIEAFKNGIYERYPLCCIVAFCLRKAKGIIIRNSLCDVYRACPVHRKKAISDYEYLRLLNNGDCPLPRDNFDGNGNYK